MIKYKQDISKGNEFYDTTSTESIETIVSFLIDTPLGGDLELSIGSTSSDYVVTDIIWSPSGASHQRASLLAAITTRHELLIYEAVKNANVTKWPLKYYMNRLLLEYWNLTGKTLNHKDCQRLRIHSASWSEQLYDNIVESQTSYLAMGLESGEIIIYQHDVIHGLQGYFKLETHSLAGDNWITGLEFSPRLGDDVFLAIKTSDNRLLLGKFQWKEGRLNFIELLDTCEPGRFQISCIKWHSTGTQLLLVATKPSHLSVWKISNGEMTGSARVFTNIAPEISGVTLSETSSNAINITCVSSYSDIFSCALTIDTMVVNEVNDTPLRSFITKRTKRAADNIAIDLICYACEPHPHGTYLVFAYMLSPSNSLKYPIASQQILRLAFCPLLDLSSLDELKVKAEPAVLESSISSLWELMTLQRLSPRAIRDSFQEVAAAQIISRVSAITPRPISDSATLLEKLRKCFYADPQLDATRLVSLWTSKDNHLETLSRLANIVVKSKEASEVTPDSIDGAIIQALSKFCDDNQPIEHLKATTAVSISGGYFESSFDFSDISNSSCFSISSETKHVWRRCSLTLLPLTTSDTLTCSICFRKILSKSWFKHQKQESGIISNSILEALDICIYCGGRYHKRK